MAVGKFEYAGTNSKGEVKLRRSTNQSLEDTLEFLDIKEIEYEVKEGAYCINFTFLEDTYQYFWTTGRWGAYENKHGNSKFRFPSQHYMAESIEDLYERWLEPKLSEPKKKQFNRVWQPPKEKL